MRLDAPWRALIVLALLALASTPALAARVQNLYSAELVVAQQAMQVDAELGGQALAQVLVRVSGRPQVVDSEVVVAALGDPSRFIQQFSYQHAGFMVTNEAGEAVPAQRLRIDFIPSLVDQLLQATGFQPLGAVRPGVLVWIVEERGGRREFIGREEDPALGPLREQAQARGLPIFRPLLDIEDQNALTVGDAWGFFAEPVLAASARYQADAALVGRVFLRDGRWQSRWMLLHGGKRELFDGEGRSIGQNLSFAVDQTADRLFADYVVALDNSAVEAAEGVLIEVGGVDRFADYAVLVDALKELSVVRSLQLVEQNYDVLTLRLQLNGSPAQLQRALALSERLRRADAPLQPLSQAQLHYRWGG